MEQTLSDPVDLWKISGKELIDKHLTIENVDIAIQRLLRETDKEKRIGVYGKIEHKLGLPLNDILNRELQFILENNSWAGPSEILEAATMDIDTFLAKRYEQRPFYLSPWLQPGTLAEIYGATGIGKSYLAYAIALSVTHGVDIAPWVAENAGGVLIFDGEMPCQSIQQRLKMLSVDLPKRKSPISIISSVDIQRQNYSSPNLALREWRDALTDHIKKHPQFKILILDNVVSLFPGLDENSAKEWSPSNQWMIKVRSLGVALIKIIHPTKAGKSSRGTGLQRDNMDTIIKLQRPGGYHPKQGARFEVHFEKGRELFGYQAEPFIFQIVPDPSNPEKLTWVTGKIGRHESEEINRNKKKIIRLLDAGVKQKEIAKQVGCKPQYVSTTKKKSIQEGILTDKCRFTDTGRDLYSDDVEGEEDE